MAFGPELPFTTTSICCSAARQNGHSCIAQHFGRLKRRCADKEASLSQYDIGSAEVEAYFIKECFDLKYTNLEANSCHEQKYLKRRSKKRAGIQKCIWAEVYGPVVEFEERIQRVNF